MLTAIYYIYIMLTATKIVFFLQFCDFREDRMESRHVCRTEMNKKCEPVTESGCLDVTELR